MAQLVYTRGKQEVMERGLIPTGSEDYRLILLDGSLGYAANASHSTVADVAAYELVTTGYSRQTLPLLGIVTTGTQVGFGVDMVTFTDIGPTLPATKTIQSGVVYRYVDGTAANDWLLAYCDSITATTNGDDLIVTWDPKGLFFI